jgi:hypothetical protein
VLYCREGNTVQNDPKTLIEVLVWLVSVIASLEAGQILGPYAAIVVASGVGGYMSLTATTKEMPKWWSSWVYILIRIALAAMVTVPISLVLGNTADWLSEKFTSKAASWLVPNLTIIPIALVVGWVSDYETVRAWVLRKLKIKIEEKLGDDHL